MARSQIPLQILLTHQDRTEIETIGACADRKQLAGLSSQSPTFA